MMQPIINLWTRYNHINWTVVDQSLVSAINFFTSILLARFLGIEEFGRFTLLWLLVIFLQSLQQSTINSPMKSIGPKQPEENYPVYFGALIIQLIIYAGTVSLLLFFGLKGASMWFPEWGVENYSLPLAIATFAILLQDFLRHYFFTKRQPRKAFISDAIRYVGQIAAILWLFFSQEASLEVSKILWIMAIMAGAGAAYGACHIEKIELRRSGFRETTSRHWQFSKWLIPSTLMQWTNGNLFMILAGALLGSLAVGALKATRSLMGFLHILFQSLENFVPMRATKYFHDGGKNALRDYLNKVTLYGAGPTALFCIIASAAPDFWLLLVFGQEYQKYGFLLQWFSGVYMLIFLSCPLRFGLWAMEHSKPIFWTYLKMTLFTLVAAYPLTKFLGFNGVMLGIFTVNSILVFNLWVSLKNKLAY